MVMLTVSPAVANVTFSKAGTRTAAAIVSSTSPAREACRETLLLDSLYP